MSYQTYAPSPQQENGYDWHECFCCPYGYHIDLDFVRYCESISREADNRTGSFKRRKDRRRQRQSMEVLLGLTPPVTTSLEHQFKTLPEQKSPTTQPTKFKFVGDGFDDAVSDFEKTLQRSKHKVQNNLPDVTAVTGKFLFIDTFNGPDTKNDTLVRLSDARTKLTLTIDQKEYIFKFTGAVELQKPVTKTKEHFLKNIGHYVAICRRCDKSF